MGIYSNPYIYETRKTLMSDITDAEMKLNKSFRSDGCRVVFYLCWESQSKMIFY